MLTGPGFAARAAAEPGTNADRIAWMVRRAWLRPPTAPEAADLAALADRHGLEAVARALFNADDFLFID